MNVGRLIQTRSTRLAAADVAALASIFKKQKNDTIYLFICFLPRKTRKFIKLLNRILKKEEEDKKK